MVNIFRAGLSHQADPQAEEEYVATSSVNPEIWSVRLVLSYPAQLQLKRGRVKGVSEVPGHPACISGAARFYLCSESALTVTMM